MAASSAAGQLGREEEHVPATPCGTHGCVKLYFTADSAGASRQSMHQQYLKEEESIGVRDMVAGCSFFLLPLLCVGYLPLLAQIPIICYLLLLGEFLH